MPNDEQYMQRCLALAKQGEYYVAPNPMVGAVLISETGEILSEGWHMQWGGPHAEVNCFKQAEERGVSEDVIHSATLYVSLEPCSHFGKTPPCADLIINKMPRRVVCGMRDPNPLVAGRGIARISEAGIEVTTGVCETECRFLNRRFLMLQEQHRPYIILKWAQTADGYIDASRPSATGFPHAAPVAQPLLISTPETKKIVHRMRAENMAIMVGSGTVLADDPHLTLTHWHGRNPVRIVLDRRQRVTPDARVRQGEDLPSDYLPDLPRTLIISDFTDWHTLFASLADRGLHSVLVEGGATILNSLLRANMYDELHIEVNPCLMAGGGVPAPVVPLEGMKKEQVDGNLLYSSIKS